MIITLLMSIMAIAIIVVAVMLKKCKQSLNLLYILPTINAILIVATLLKGYSWQPDLKRKQAIEYLLDNYYCEEFVDIAKDYNNRVDDYNNLFWRFSIEDRSEYKIVIENRDEINEVVEKPKVIYCYALVGNRVLIFKRPFEVIDEDTIKAEGYTIHKEDMDKIHKYTKNIYFMVSYKSDLSEEFLVKVEEAKNEGL